MKISASLAFSECIKKNKRIPEYENSIITNDIYSYFYARDIIKGPFKEGEEKISQDSYASYLYARDVIQGPFLLGHNIILNSEWKKDYLKLLKEKGFIEWLI